MKNKVRLIRVLGATILIALGAILFGMNDAQAQGPTPRTPRALAGTAFTYQGQLKNGGSPVNGTCDFQFKLYDSSNGGIQVGSTQNVNNVNVANGLFTTSIDLGANAFTGDARWLDISVRCPAGSGSYTSFTSRQALTPAPMALALPGLYTQQNAFSPNVIGGYSGNIISPTLVGGTISGGGTSGAENRVWSDYATIGGGTKNIASGQNATVSGGANNTASGLLAIVSGGTNNNASNGGVTIGGGKFNTASGDSATISGGANNTASSTNATIGGGANNTANNQNSTVGGGFQNSATGYNATVPGGYGNTASGAYSFAAGYNAQAIHSGSFVWVDSTVGASGPWGSDTANQFRVFSTGGVQFITGLNLATGNVTAGSYLNAGSGTWSSFSDRNVKANFENVDTRAVLARLNSIPIQKWNYIAQDASIRHIGPMAQDFYSAFGVGEDERYIGVVDADGVALAAIQGLTQVVQEKDAKINVQQKQIDSLEARVAALEQLAQANSAPVHSDNTNNVALIAIGGLIGIVVTQKPWQRGQR